MSVSQPTIDQLIDALRPVQDPELHRSIVDLGMVRDVVIDKKGTVGLTVVLTIAGCPLRNEIQTRVNTALRALDGVSDVNLNFGVMNDDERFESPAAHDLDRTEAEMHRGDTIELRLQDRGDFVAELKGLAGHDGRRGDAQFKMRSGSCSDDDRGGIHVRSVLFRTVR